MRIASILISYIAATAAAPALIWKSGQSASVPTKHSSDQIDASRLITSTVRSAHQDDLSLSTVFFLVGRDESGNEALSHLTSSGKLPGVSSRYDNVHSIHYHVDGIESSTTVARDAMKGLKSKKNDARVVETSLDEFHTKLNALKENVNIAEEAEVLPTGQIVSKPKKEARKRGRALDEANVIVVKVPHSESNSLDAAVSEAIDNTRIGSVVLAGIRSVDEVKRERGLEARRRFQLMNKVNRRSPNSGRRLEDQQDDAADDDANAEEEGTYYVYMTPNILAGIMFIVFFFLVAYTGITCMGMISGQDVYVTKYPSIGREA